MELIVFLLLFCGIIFLSLFQKHQKDSTDQQDTSDDLFVYQSSVEPKSTTILIDELQIYYNNQSKLCQPINDC